MKIQSTPNDAENPTIATILCGLRRVQSPTHAIGNSREPLGCDDHFTNATPLDDKAIDRLCENLNSGNTILVERGAFTKDDARALLDWVFVQSPDSRSAEHSVTRQACFLERVIAAIKS